MHAPPIIRSRTVSTGRAGAGYWTRLLPPLTVLACATRLPSFTRPLWNPDEGFLAVQAGLLAHGGRLYETVVDRKPPLVPWLYQGAFAVTGAQSLTTVRVLALLAQLATAVLLASLARRRWGDTAGRTAGVLYLLLSVGLNPEDAQAATFEVFILPCTAAAMWCADRRRWGAAGLAVGCAFLAKQTGGAVLLPVLWLCGAHRPALLRLGAGAVAPVLGAALLTDPAGFLFWTVTGSGTYASFDGSATHALGRALANAALLAVACAALLGPLARLRRTPRSGMAGLGLWLAASAGAVATGLHFFGHYYLQLLPPLALLGTAALLRHPPRERPAGRLLATACCTVLFVTWGLLAPRGELDHARRLAETAARHTAPGERVLFWGMHPEAYWFAGRAPATRYLTAGLLTNYSGGRDGARVGERYGVEGSWQVLRAELAARPPALIVDDSRGKPYAPERLPTLRRLLAAAYTRAGTVDGAVLYVRTAGQAPETGGGGRPGPGG
ncbi:ArnT family glycosyltransferase [Streptomyces tagetis]|uniref:Glycosyltransferase family 39 protein n=1 Tax=Streptomyces tagetis TaxID=2820809 RepID=A0A940XD99_9ACTN|nr:glycosyltransferase family 39 protein [Streptomyces sp. RG38]MBQ0825307.1 glycosyltransferase family 39 protein [Streptomyces sp. RG38]